MTEDTNQRGEMLRAFLAEHDEACPGCGYNLRGLTGAACPECGKTLRLRVAEMDQGVGLLMAGLIGLVSGAGFFGYWMAYLLYIMVKAVGGLPNDNFVTPGVGFVVCGGGTVAWLRSGAWIRRRGTQVRWALTACCWGVPMALATWFFLFD